MSPIGPIRLIGLIGLMALWLMGLPAQAQIKIGGSVYGGGNMGNVHGSTKVTVQKGNLEKVFGGARMANVGGHTFVHIDGEHATGETTIVAVYGGNDISGTIGTPATVGQTVPAELTDVIATEGDRAGVTPASRQPYMNVVDDTWNCFVRTTRSKDGSGNEKWPVVIGSLFGGGNGEFTYTNDDGTPLMDNEGNYIAKEGDKTVAVSETPLFAPDIDKTYLELKGGDICHAYGGGNNATIRENTTLNIANESSDLLAMSMTYAPTKGMTVPDLLTYFKDKVKLNSLQVILGGSFDYNFARIYGGNNRAEMAIQPTWNLQQGKIRDLYSGGNRGNMTCPEGLLMDIKPEVDEALWVDNVYGGCRMADVKPTVNGEYTLATNLTGYYFPNELSARTLIRGGHIKNVYGGNDVTGTVYGGNAVGIYATVYGDVYGGGNGSYPYTDNETMKDDEIYGDFYYGDKIQDGQTSYEALNAFRPNAEQVSLRLAGNAANDPTIVHGSIFVGGNCASLATKKKNPMVELKIGSHVVADNVYLGNNGEGMKNEENLAHYIDDSFSSLSLTDPSVFAHYMEGVTMTLQPSIVFDNTANGDPATYLPYSSYIGSFFCGGNVGSMAIPGKETFTVSEGLNIYNKFVGGCNNADVPAGTYNAAYKGGLLGATDERDSYTDASGNIKDRLEINMDNLTIVPLRWNDDHTQLIWNTNKWGDAYSVIEKDSVLEVGSTYYTYNSGTKTYEEQTVTVSPITADGETQFETYEDFVEIPNSEVDDDTRLLGGNVYGGCYESGHVNGNVVININEDVMQRDEVFGNGVGIYGRPASGVNLEEQRLDLMAVALTVFGGGYGEDTEIWGSTTLNHNNGYVFQIFGGGELGVVGKKREVLDGSGNVIDYTYDFDPAYSTTVNLCGTATIYSHTGEVENLAETEFIYGGGNEGDVCGNTLVNLGNGRIYDAFGGASDADILGHSEVYIGRQPNGSGGYKEGFPWIMDIVYGGNDFGGTIYGEYEDGYDFEARLRDYNTDKTQLHGYKAGEIPDVLKSSSYVEYLTGRVDSIFGAGYGYYDYSDVDLYGSDAEMPVQHSSFVNLRPNDHEKNKIKGVFGGSTGFPGNRSGDNCQDRSYVLVDIPDHLTQFSNLEVFGGGSFNGIGMGVDKEKLANGTPRRIYYPTR